MLRRIEVGIDFKLSLKELVDLVQQGKVSKEEVLASIGKGSTEPKKFISLLDKDINWRN